MGKTLTPGFIRVHRKNMRVPQSVSTDWLTPGVAPQGWFSAEDFRQANDLL